MAQKIVIDPVTRVEGHGRVSIHLDEAGRVEEARFHIVARSFLASGHALNCDIEIEQVDIADVEVASTESGEDR